MFWIIVIAVVVAMVIGAINSTQKHAEASAKNEKLGYSEADKIVSGKYIAGHPDLNDSIELSCLFNKNNSLEIFNNIVIDFVPMPLAFIPNAKVKNVLVEDQSTVEKRVTLGRVLLTGVFALAWKKKKVNESAFMTIEWNDGKFDHETIFEFTGLNAMQRANTARNLIIKAVR